MAFLRLSAIARRDVVLSGMYTSGISTDQRAGVRPISFVLDNQGTFGSQVVLKLRSEDFTRTKLSRNTASRMLGRSIIDRADSFGPGLQAISIAGYTGWRTTNGFGEDGETGVLSLAESPRLTPDVSGVSFYVP